jgi:hypothetical protein
MMLPRTFRGLLAGALALGAVLALASPAAAQRREGGYVVGPDGEPVTPDINGRRPANGFQLFAGRDAAVTSLKGVGYFNRLCMDNFALGDIDAGPCGPYFQLLPGVVFQALWFRSLDWEWAVPPGDWINAKALVPSLVNVRGGGYSASNRHGTGVDDMGALDGTLGLYHAGITSTSDGGCRDHRVANTATNIPAGNPLLAGSDCPATWGTLGWQGARAIPLEVYLAHFAAEGSAFRFDFWRIPGSELDALGIPLTKPIGSFQAYGFSTDANSDILAGTSTVRSFGNVIPGGSGAPTRPGWPLGIDVRNDAFTFQLPSLKEISYYQTVMVNHSQRVYGVGLTYDSLYINLGHGWFNDLQSTYVYDLPEIGAIVGVGATVRPCLVSREISDITCSRVGNAGAALGFLRGTAAIIVLKSPIGDLRNKWFSRVGSPFYNPAHPAAGDTLTFNHHHMCGFRACSANVQATDPALPDHEQRQFGMFSSTEANVLGTRTASGLTDQVFWHTFRSAQFPSRAGNQYFNRYVPPGNWDWNHDGKLDTLFLDMCKSPAGCSGIFSDTTVNGKMGAYSNVGGVMGVGPLHLAPGDSISFVFALMSGVDSASLRSEISAAIDNYMNFYLGPEAPPKSRVVATEARPAEAGGQVSFYWDEAAETFTDPFLRKQYNDLLAADTLSPLGRLRLLNPRLDDTLAYLSTHNLARLHIFKSCDGGGSWTDDPDCLGDPALGGIFQGVGWQPYATFNYDTQSGVSGIPNSFTDRNVTNGLRYTYNIVGESRGANLVVLNGDTYAFQGGIYVCTSNCRTEVLSLAPVLLNALSGSTSDPNVARVYLPISSQAGALRSRATVVDSAGPIASQRLILAVTADSIGAADYQVGFGVGGRAVKLTYHTGNRTDSVRTTVTLLGGAAPVVLTGRNAGGYTVNGGTTVTTVVSPTLTKDSTAFASSFLVLSRLVGAVAQDPLLVTSTLTGVATTPGSFFGNPDFPGFTVEFDATLGGLFNVQSYRAGDGSTIGPLIEPATIWLVAAPLTARVAAATPVSAGTYQWTWAAQAFGTAEPFTLDFVNRAQTVLTIQQSLTGRAVGQTGDVTAATAAKIQTATGVITTTDSLVAVKVPFTIRNLSFGRDVAVAMRKRADNTILVGNGADTVRVTVGADEWVPGDRLYLLEPDGAGALQVTFSAATIGCDQTKFTRTSCNPVRLATRGGSVWLGPQAGQALIANWHVPVNVTSRFTINTAGPLRGTTLTNNPDAVRAGLAAIRVVPNPYIMVSQYANNTLLFTHVPPRGVLRVYTITGQFAQQLTWVEADLGPSGDLAWDLRTREGNLMASGLYIYVLHARDANDLTIGTRTGKFVVIR